MKCISSNQRKQMGHVFVNGIGKEDKSLTVIRGAVNLIGEKREKNRGDGEMNFGQALEALKNGQKVAREGWNGKGQWTVLMPALYLEAGMVNGRTRKHIGEDVPLDSQPYFALFTAQQKWQPGWVPSTSDVLAEDWTIVD